MTARAATLPSRWASGTAIMLASAISVGIGNAFIPIYYAAGGNAPTIMAFRYIWCILVSLVILGVLGRPMRLPRRLLAPAFSSGALFGAGAIAVINAFAYIPVGVAILILFTFPVQTALLQALLNRRMPGLLEFACLVVALGGVGLTVGMDDVAYDMTGVALSLLASLSVTLAFVAGGRALDGADSILVSTYVALAALLVALAFAGFSARGVVLTLGDGGWRACAVVVVSSAVSFFGLMIGMKRVGTVPAAMLTNFEVVFTMLFAALLLGEIMTPVKVGGAAIVIGAVLVAQWQSWRRR
jgi:drug/metabolite transporter (DMT)-like permease